MTNNILIVGFGSIGKRHFQGISQFDKKLNIFIYDKNKIQNIKTSTHHKITIVDKIENLKSIFFKLVIVSTSVTERYKITKNLIRKLNIKILILEKFVFNSIYQFKNFKKIIEEKKLNTYINCPRRYFKMYNYLRKLKKKNNLHIEIFHKNFGILSNTIHFIDALKFILNDKIHILKIQIELEKIYLTKRINYQDIRGNLKIFFNNNNLISISDIKNSKKDSLNIIYSDNKKILIDEKNNFIKINNRKIRFSDSLYQSSISYDYINEIFKNEKIKLPTYNELLSLNLRFISSIKSDERLKNIKFT